MDFLFFFNSILLGAGLAMDAFSVSIADSILENGMDKRHMSFIAGTFALFQTLMPLIGWLFVRTIVSIFGILEAAIPWIALVLLVYIGVKMLLEKDEGQSMATHDLGRSDAAAATEVRGHIPPGTIFVQGIATSIDALSVGFTIATYGIAAAVTASVIIGIVTFMICFLGLNIGQVLGSRMKGKANKIGGIILILIGIEIFVRSFF